MEKKFDCTMVQLGESKINSFGAWLYEIDCPLGKIYVVQHEQKDNTIIDEYRTDKAEAEKLYKKHIKKILAEN